MRDIYHPGFTRATFAVVQWVRTATSSCESVLPALSLPGCANEGAVRESSGFPQG